MSDISIRGPERQAGITLRDGRKLAWSEWGPENGKCVLFCTGAGMSGSLGFGADVVHDLGVRLIGIDRPGLGRSDFDPKKSFSAWAADIGELIHQLELVRPASVGFSQGAPFTLALAHAGLVRAVAIVSGQDELSHPRSKAFWTRALMRFGSRWKMIHPVLNAISLKLPRQSGSGP